MASTNNSDTDFLLVNNIQTLDNLNDFTLKKIITFDYNSHIFLNQYKIPHNISDNFSSDSELQTLENLVYSLVRWYEIPTIKNVMLANKINLGELSFLEFRHELVSFLKKFLEISNLVKLNPNSHFFVSPDLEEIITTLSQNITKIHSPNKETSFHNSIDIPLKFGSKQFTLTLSKNNATKIQTILNKLSQNFFLNKKIHEKFSTILLVDFSTLKCEHFFLEIPHHSINMIKYDRTTPSIWNKKSLNIIKNSKCIVENESTILNKEILKNIKLNQQLFLSKLESVSLSTDLKNHFTFNGSNFWNAIKPLFMRFYKKRFIDAANEIELAKNLFKKYSFSKIVLFNESKMTEQIILHLANEKKIPVYVLQHGLYYDSEKMFLENSFQRIIPKNANNVITWGNSFKKYLEQNKIDSKNIISIGSIFFDKIFQQNTITNYESGNILLASDPLAFNRPIDLSFNQKELYQQTIKEISKIVSKNNKKLTIKTHPQKNQFEKESVKNIDSSIRVIPSGDIYPLIQSSDLVIVTDVSTVILEAMIMQKPVISIRMKEHYGKPEIFNYCNQISLDSLNSWIKFFYSNPEMKNTLIAKGNEFLKKYFINQGSASQELLNFLQKV